MAIADTLTVVFKGEDESLGRTANALGKPFNQLGKAVAGAAAVGVAGAAALGAGIAAVGVEVFNMSNEISSATKNIQSELGLTATEATNLGNIAAEVWGNNFAGSITEAGEAITLVRRDLGALNDNELQDAAENAFRLQDAWGIDLAEGINAASVLTEEFGLTQQEAFDLIASGMQNGLNQNDDFLDSIGEYSNLFADAGFDAAEFYSIMETGAAGGVLGTDKISDAIKEMGIILNEGGDEAADVFSQIGLDFEQISASVAAGDEAWADYFPQIVSGLNSIEDPIARSQAQTALFGTMAEDLGVAFTEGLSASATALEDMSGAIDSVDVRYTNLGDVVEGFRRQFLLSLRPVGDLMLNLANQAMPMLQQAFEAITPFVENFVFFIQDFVFYLQSGEGFVTALTTAFIDFAYNLGLTSEQSAALSEQFTAFVEKVVQVKDQVVAFIEPIVQWIANTVSLQDVMIALGVVLGGVVLSALVSLASAIAPVLIAGAALIALVTAIRIAWETDWLGIRSFIEEIAPQIQEIINMFLTTVQEFWALHGEAIMETVSVFLTAIGEFFMTNLEAIMEIIRGFIALFQGDWEGFLEHIGNSLRLQIEAIVLLFARIGLQVIPKIQAFGEMAIAKFKEIGNAIVDGLANAISSGASKIAEAARNAAMSAFDAAKAALGISSPSKLFEGIGTNVVEGFAQGIKGNQQLVEAAMQSVGIQPTFSGGTNGATTNNNNTTQVFQWNVQTGGGFNVEAETRAAQAIQGGI